jgi:oxalate decarboxylase/phosphoglucose isomerase-like protein (cupin superfamily)
MNVVYFNPCGFNLPHIHHRASTIYYVAKGTIRCGFWTENTGEFHSFILNEGQGITFGPGAIHFEQNMRCDNAVLVAAFNNEDPGTSQLTESIKALPLDILSATLGQSQNQINNTRQNYHQSKVLIRVTNHAILIQIHKNNKINNSN